MPLLSERHISRCYYSKDTTVDSMQLHGFCDASEDSYACVVYTRVQDGGGKIHILLVVSKTKVAPIKRLTLPRLKLCGAQLLAKLLQHTKQALNIPTQSVYAWTDSTIVLSWLIGNPCRFKTFVCNRVSNIVQLIPPDRWRLTLTVLTIQLTVLLVACVLWNWSNTNCGGTLPKLHSTHWPTWSPTMSSELPGEEERDVCLHTMINSSTPIISLEQSSSFLHLKRVMAWILRFINNCRHKKQDRSECIDLSTTELIEAETYWFLLTQQQTFPEEFDALKHGDSLPNSSHLFSLHPFDDPYSVLVVGDGIQRCTQSFTRPYYQQSIH